MNTGPAPPIVADTNILVAAGYSESSASRKIILAVLEEKLDMIVSEAILREYRFILPRALRRREFMPQIESALKNARLIVPSPYGGIAPPDPDDTKFLAAAHSVANATVITNDDHLLALGDKASVRIARPRVFWEWWVTRAERDPKP